MSNSCMSVRKQFAETGASITPGSTLEILENTKKYCGALKKYSKNTKKYGGTAG